MFVLTPAMPLDCLQCKIGKSKWKWCLTVQFSWWPFRCLICWNWPRGPFPPGSLWGRLWRRHLPGEGEVGGLRGIRGTLESVRGPDNREVQDLLTTASDSIKPYELHLEFLTGVVGVMKKRMLFWCPLLDGNYWRPQDSRPIPTWVVLSTQPRQRPVHSPASPGRVDRWTRMVVDRPWYHTLEA